jgi:radical SAM PhpK family P-methyltransferase
MKSTVKIRVGKDFNAAIGYLGTFLSRRGLTFDYTNYLEDEYAMLVHLMNTKKFRAIAVSTSFVTSVEVAKEIITLIRDIDPEVKIIVGGTFIARLIKDNVSEGNRLLSYLFRQMGGDFYINSFQGELTLVNILNTLKYNSDISQVANVYYRDKKNVFNYTTTEVEDNDLEENMVDWTLFKNKMRKIIPVRSAISCPFHCAFCTHKADAGEYRYVSVEAIERELDSIAQDETVETVHFVDDTFNMPKERFKEILKLMIRKKYKFNWYSFLRCQFVDDEIAGLMKESKCSFVLLGIESGSQKMLDIMNKQVTVDKLKNGVVMLQKHGIKMHGMFLVGFPGETEETVEETINFIKNVNFTTLSVKPWFYEVSTPIAERKEEFKIVGSHYNWKHSTMDYPTAEKYADQINSKYADKDYDKVFVSSIVIEKQIEELV